MSWMSFGHTAAVAGCAMIVAACSYGYDRPTFGQAAPKSAFAARPLLAAPPAELAALGRRLFHDQRLSGDGSQSCASCHQAVKGFADGQRLSTAGGRTLVRHTPSLFNVAYYPQLFWDGRSHGLEDQALRPVINGAEMGRHPAVLADAIAGDLHYRAMFKAAFGHEDVTEERMGRAIAAYERTLVSGTAPFDRWLAGENGAISSAAARGFALFTGKAQCSACHSGWLMSDGMFHDTGMPDSDLGRGGITNNRVFDHAFKTPSLREIGRTAPYMHDGSLATLASVVDHYADRRVKRRLVMPRITLSVAERADLVEFLSTLDSQDAAKHEPIAGAKP